MYVCMLGVIAISILGGVLCSLYGVGTAARLWARNHGWLSSRAPAARNEASAASVYFIVAMARESQHVVAVSHLRALLYRFIDMLVVAAPGMARRGRNRTSHGNQAGIKNIGEEIQRLGGVVMRWAAAAAAAEASCPADMAW